MKNLQNLVLLAGFLALLFVPSAISGLPNQIKIAAIFDQDGDRKHELAFR